MLMTRNLPKAARIVSVAAIALTSLGVSFGQDKQIWNRLYATSIDPELVAFLRRMPSDGRLLLDLAPGMGIERYHRYVIYSILRDGAFISTNDEPSPALYDNRHDHQEASFLSVPVSYVLEQGESRFGHLRVIDGYGTYRLLYAKGTELSFTLRDLNWDPVIKLTSKADGLTRTR
jgi:hypothetical protein